MRRAALITATATMLALTAPPASATASGSWAVPTTAATSTAVAAPRTLTVSLRGLPAKSAPTATITGPRGFRQQVRLGKARKTATLRLRTDGVYTVTLGVLGRGAGLRYPDRATTRVTINAKTPRPSVVRRYRPARLTFDGLGNLRLGMTVAQARQADPSLRVRDRHLCVSATSSLADTVVFNPDGRLAFITARKDVLTAVDHAQDDPACHPPGQHRPGHPDAPCLHRREDTLPVELGELPKQVFGHGHADHSAPRHGHRHTPHPRLWTTPTPGEPCGAVPTPRTPPHSTPESPLRTGNHLIPREPSGAERWFPVRSAVGTGVDGATRRGQHGCNRFHAIDCTCARRGVG